MKRRKAFSFKAKKLSTLKGNEENNTTYNYGILCDCKNEYCREKDRQGII